MNRRSILTKTGKGLMEATGKTSNLSRDLRNVLKEIDGKVSVSDLLEKLDRFNEPKLLEALGGLERDGYVREFLGPQDTGGYAPVGRAPISQAPSGAGEDLDFTAFTPKPPPREREDASRARAIRAQEEAAARAKAEAAARARAEAEQRARAALAQQPRPEARPAGGASGQAQALDQARREAEERQRKEAEEKARREAEARARIEAEERVRREAEERQRAEIQERTRREDEERARREAEARARLQAEERARKEIEDRRRREIEEQLRKEEVERRLREEQERARREAEERERRLREEREHAELMVRIEAEARAKVEAEARSRRDQEERARRDGEERRRREEDLQRRSEEEARRRKEAQEREARERMREQEEAARRELEEKIREEEERERREQEERARREQEERARQEEEGKAAGELEDIFPAEEDEEKRTKDEAKRAKEKEKQAREEKARAKREAKAAEKARRAERSRERAAEEVFRGDEGAVVQERARMARSAADRAKRRSGSPAKTLGVMLLIVLIVGAAVLPFVPIESAPYEKAAEDWLGAPVKIGSTSVVLVPSPHLKFEKVVIGNDPRMRVATVKAIPEIDWLTSAKKAFRSLELEGVVFPSRYIPVFLSNKAKGNSLRVARITAKKLKLDIADLDLPPLDVDAKLGADGAVQSVVLSSAERKLSVVLVPQGKRAAIEISADAFPLPIGGDFVLGDFLAKGTVTSGELALSEVEGRAFGGRLQGNARMRWTESWTLDGEVSARGLEAAKLAAPILAGGVLEGKGVYGMKASSPAKLFASARLDGNFTVQKGSITNVDMTRVLQGSSTGGGTTLFSEMSGSVSADPNRLSVRQLRLAAGLLNGTGHVEMDSQKYLSGRMQIELRAQTVQARATLGVAGTLKDPQFRRTN